jgi:hypothetical protein
MGLVPLCTYINYLLFFFKKKKKEPLSLSLSKCSPLSLVEFVPSYHFSSILWPSPFPSVINYNLEDIEHLITQTEPLTNRITPPILLPSSLESKYQLSHMLFGKII